MKNLSLFFILIILSLSDLCRAESYISPLDRQSVLKVNEKPMIILGGELGNSAATSPEDIRHNLKTVKKGNLNTILVPAYWDLMEPSEGKFDFSLTDSVIDIARQNDLKVVFLWFGAWKNSMSCYAPDWVKRDTKRFPRAYTKDGKPLEILSAFSEEVCKTDNKAFCNWLNHINDYDRDGTVIMVQVENEIGMLEDARDHSDLANAEFSKGVPQELTEYLLNNYDSLDPSLAERWGKNGKKMSGSWEEVFGDDIYTDEYFMAWNYARYVDSLAKEGKKITSIPFYLNAAMNSRGRKPGEYPSAGPLPHLKDIWNAGAPNIDFISPDIYDDGFADWVKGYDFKGNTMFVPEVKRDLKNPAYAYYLLGHHNAIGISPFAIENGDSLYFSSLAETYRTLEQIVPLLTNPDSNEGIDGVLLTKDQPTEIINDGETRITLSHYFTLPWDPRAGDKDNWNDTGAILIKLAPEEYLLAGTGVVAKFEDEKENSISLNLGEDGFASAGNQNSETEKTGKTPRVGLATVEEVKINPDGSLKRVRSFNGDETHQGRHARISVDDNKILHIKAYRY